MVTIPRHFITSWDIDIGDNGGGFDFTGVLPISSTDTPSIRGNKKKHASEYINLGLVHIFFVS